MRRLFLILAILFISGLIAADICVGGLQGDNQWLTIDVFKEYAYSNVAFKDVIWNMLYERGKLIIGLAIIGFTPLRNKLPIFLMSIFSFCFGFFVMSCTLVLSFVGVIIAFASFLPHGLFYMGIIAILSREHSVGSYRSKDSLVQIITTYLFVLLLFLSGCIMECVVGVHFVPWVIRLSLV